VLNISDLRTYKALKYENGQQSGQCGSTRKFCGECSTMLWVFDEQWAHVSCKFR
jgi:hypothetical protein